MGTRARLHADQASGPPFEEGQKLTAPDLAMHHPLAAVIDAVNLKNVLGEIDADGGSFGHGWLLGWDNDIPAWRKRRREQEPSTPSIENAFAKLKALLRKA